MFFSSCSKWRLLSACSTQASHCCGFSCRGARARPLAFVVHGSVAAAPGSAAQALFLRCVGLATPGHVEASRTRGQTRISCIGRGILYHKVSGMGKQWQTIFWGSKITADGDCSHKVKRHLLLGRKAMTNLDSILKSRNITLPTKVHLVKAMVFPVVMYECESWNVKKAEHQRLDAFELWCWRRPLRVPWTAGRSNQSILKEISPEYLLEGLMLKLKLQYFGHLMWRADSLEKTLMLGKIEGRRRREQ